MTLCVVCRSVEVLEEGGFCPECDALWSCGDDCDCLVCGPASARPEAADRRMFTPNSSPGSAQKGAPDGATEGVEL